MKSLILPVQIIKSLVLYRQFCTIESSLLIIFLFNQIIQYRKGIFKTPRFNEHPMELTYRFILLNSNKQLSMASGFTTHP